MGAAPEKEVEIRELNLEAMEKVVGGVGKQTTNENKNGDGEGILLPEIEG